MPDSFPARLNRPADLPPFLHGCIFWLYGFRSFMFLAHNESLRPQLRLQ
jgi:hypothetical protein